MRCGRGDNRRFIDIGDGDGHGLGRDIGAIGSAYRDIIDIVGAGIGGRFVIGRRLEGDGARRRIDIEPGRVGSRERIGQRGAGILVGRRNRVDGSAGILGKTGRSAGGDDWRFIDIGDGDGHGLGRGIGAIGSADRDVIDIVAAGIGWRFEVR